ncbi:MAG: hypothetical protein CMN30_00725 [Sandaracinus sp.]|nr:hypothetical protein [Sandaracinus sp.]
MADDDAPEEAEETETETSHPRPRRARKDKVLHTRVPEVLEEELKALASSWRVPVSNVVRTLLEDAIDVMSAAEQRAQSELRSLSDRIGGAARPHAAKPAPAPPKAPLDGALGFSELTLAQAAVCGVTGAALEEGGSALLVHFADGRPPLVVAPSCRALLG